MFVKVYIALFTIYLAFLGIYWGSWYQRSTRLVNLHMLIVNEDTQVGSVPPLVGDALWNTTLIPNVAPLAGWRYMSSTEISASAAEHKNTVQQEISRLVHHQKYWAAIWIKPNASYDIYTAMQTLNGSFSAANSLIECVYETGRDLLGMNSYVIPSLLLLEKVFVDSVSSTIYPQLLSLVSQDAKSQLFSNSTLATNVIMTKPSFLYLDNRPVIASAAIGPGELGLIYTLVLSFHQYNFGLRITEAIRPKLKAKHFMYYRVLASQSAFFFIALVYGLMTLAYQVPLDRAFGNSGFLVYWAIIYLNLSALGAINECVSQLIMAYDRTLAGYWMVFHVVISISVTFSPIPLCPAFYRYGYAMPLRCTYELLKVVLFDTYKGNMWKYFVINVSWIILFNAIMPFSLKLACKIAIVQQKKAAEQAKKLAEEKQRRLDAKKHE
ncbi:hypothetical protein BABINDRAFT_35153 [Babjeviella inositovora NRRL Y-12698]|uniref:DUF3533 domain-containing protein n=1 Tax=Babjeviella inositovora NRRL Y-12698 TaxID=984486 RepID=A0A1E3QSU6_9ASCO|nr:uncharacterized protein BABINDRAFT_35153 [Babjeviella inositovora NRRL Y-12698]ODQ80740.1 hypothetical protein BABINDRAFT_35153 [Babjeviella inositovora NRRL Y-12698]